MYRLAVISHCYIHVCTCNSPSLNWRAELTLSVKNISSWYENLSTRLSQFLQHFITGNRPCVCLGHTQQIQHKIIPHPHHKTTPTHIRPPNEHDNTTTIYMYKDGWVTYECYQEPISPDVTYDWVTYYVTHSHIAVYYAQSYLAWCPMTHCNKRKSLVQYTSHTCVHTQDNNELHWALLVTSYNV